MVSIDDFKKIEMRIGTILSAEYIEGADKLLKLTVDFGLKPRSERGSPLDSLSESGEQKIVLADPALRDLGQKDNAESEISTGEARPVVAAEPLTTGEREVRQILSGIREYYSPEQLVGKQCPFVTNLEPRTMRGLVSEGMILAVKTKEGGAMLLHPDKATEAGNMLS